jgi:hypothetical protein
MPDKWPKAVSINQVEDTIDANFSGSEEISIESNTIVGHN